MLKKVTITNYRGESVEYLIEGVNVADNNGLLITDIDGLGPVKANINMTKLATADGGIYNSARLGNRNIVIKARFTNATSIEDARLSSYQFFPIKKKVTFKIETDHRTAFTEGYVESNTPNPFSEKSDVQISILCESAFFYAPSEDVTTFAGVDSLFEFPFENNVEMVPTEVVLKGETITTTLLNSLAQSGFLRHGYEGTPESYSYQYWAIEDGRKPVYVATNSPNYDNYYLLVGVTYTPVSEDVWLGAMSVADIEDYEHMTFEDAVVFLDNGYPGAGGGDGRMDVLKIGLKYSTYAPSPETAKQLEFGEVVLKKFANVYYSGDSQVGCTIELHFIGNVTKDITIYNYYTRERMEINMERLSAIIGDTLILGDTLTVCTVEGKKSFSFTRNAVTTNVLNALDKNVDWITLSKGDNVIGFIADEDEQSHIKLTITSQVAYEGV